MNDDIKKGAMQMADGLKAEAKEAMGKIDEVKGKLDTNNDGTVDFDELKDGVFGEAKEGFDKLKALIDSGDLPQKVKEELAEAVEKIKPAVEAKKMEAQIAKEKLEAEINHKKEVKSLKDEIL